MTKSILFFIFLFCFAFNNYSKAQNDTQNISGFKGIYSLKGDNGLVKYISRNIRYPDDDINHEGCFLISAFFINDNGNLDSVTILNNANKIFASLALQDFTRMHLARMWEKGNKRIVIIPILYTPYTKTENKLLDITTKEKKAIRNRFTPIQCVFMNVVTMQELRPSYNHK